MKREVNANGHIIRYELQYKKVKNINLRIKSDGTIHISANRNVPVSVTDDMVLSNAENILKVLKKCEKMNNTELKQYFTEEELRIFVCDFCEKIYPYYAAKGIKRPEIKFRKMVSRWGSCQPSTGVVMFSKNLMYAPQKCVEYVIWHEFTHFLEANHSKAFYNKLSAVFPEWKACKQILKEINIRRA